MGMIEWAEQEIAAIKKENDSDSYLCECLDCAMEGYRTIMLQGHSGMSYHLTVHYLTKLLNETPLVEVRQDDDQWVYTSTEIGPDQRREVYTHLHMPGLFKNVYQDGHVEYFDARRDINCYDINSDFGPYFNGFISRIVHKYFPITFPYVRKHYKVYTTSFCVNPGMGDYDTKAITAIFDGDTGDLLMSVNRYFKILGNKFIEIDFNEYVDRWNHRIVENK